MNAAAVMKETPYACFCLQLSWSELIERVNCHNLATVEELQDQTCAGRACRGCVTNLKSLFELRPVLSAL